METDDPGRKAAVRREVRCRRAAMSPAARAHAAHGLADRLSVLAAATGARRIASYAPRPDEPDVSGFTELALTEGIEVMLPVSNPDRTLSWALAALGAGPGAGAGSGAGAGAGSGAGTRGAVAPGLHGIMEPVGERLPPAAIQTADLVLVPACAVDARGTRLGWGLGYYDRALADLDPATPVYAVVFDEDLFPALPREAHDAPVTGVVTPTTVVAFRNGYPEPLGGLPAPTLDSAPAPAATGEDPRPTR